MDRILLDTYENFVRHLEDREYFGQHLGLDRIRRLLERLGDPQKKFPSIHIAGTNGKGSTAAMLASILKEAGLRAGLFTSPHLIDFCERIQNGGILISPDQVLHYARLIRDVEDEPLTFFEMATAIAFLHFAGERVPVAVVETGLGGRLDATNVICPLVSVITSIGFDHTAHLGNTLPEIAFEKGGIIKEGVPVVVGSLPPEALQVVREIAAARKSPLAPLLQRGDGGILKVGLAGDHQRQNAAVAVAVIEKLRGQGWSISGDAVRKGLENVHWPGRMETVSEKPWVLLDGAHNREAMRAVRAFLEERLGGRRLGVVFGCMADKDGRGLLAEIAPVTSEFVLTPLGLKRGASPEDLRRMAAPAEIPWVLSSVPEALETALHRIGPGGVILVTGSFYLVGEVRRFLKKP